MLNTDSARTILERMTMSGAAAGDYRPDIIMADDIIGGALLQVAANPKLAGGAGAVHSHTRVFAQLKAWVRQMLSFHWW